jgi:hypothetical protein
MPLNPAEQVAYIRALEDVVDALIAKSPYDPETKRYTGAIGPELTAAEVLRHLRTSAAMREVTEMKTFEITELQIDKLIAAAHSGGLLGGEAAYKACLEIGAVLATIKFEQSMNVGGIAPETKREPLGFIDCAGGYGEFFD